MIYILFLTKIVYMYSCCESIDAYAQKTSIASRMSWIYDFEFHKYIINYTLL